MKAGLMRLVGGIVALLVSLTCAVDAQDTYSQPQAAEDSLFSAEQLDQLLSPVALYPDPLLAQILMASTYPLEVVEAARWVRQPGNAALRGDQLAAALEGMDWDPSVKSLVPFPQILQMMDGRLDWMEQLGDAFLAQPDEVTDSVQRLRRAARAAGTLQSTPEQVVTDEGSTIVIEPARPDLVYVPAYDPRYVYGPWQYPAYPPLYIYPPGYVIVRDAIVFGLGMLIVRSLWGWNYWDWPHHRIGINVTRFNVINVRRPRITANIWQHDSYHRRSVPYRDPRSRQAFERSRVIAPEPPRSFRGYVDIPRAAPPSPTVRPAPGVAPQPRAVPPRPAAPPPRPATAPAPGVAPPPGPTARPAPGVERPPSPGARPAPRAAPAQPVAPPPSPREQRVVPTQPPAARTPPAFEGIGRGHDVRAQESRGRASQTMPQRTPPAPSAGPPGAGAGRAGETRGRAAPGSPRR